MKATLTLALTLLLGSAGVAHAQRAHIGPRIGFDFDAEDALIGGQILLPITRSVELYPSFDYYLRDAGTWLGFNGDLRFRLNARTRSVVYLGAGLGVLHRSDGVDDTDAGLNLFGGLDAHAGAVHPFVEGRLRLNDGSAFQILAGLNFTLY